MAMRVSSHRLVAGAALGALSLMVSANAAHAVPAFAVQTGRPCQACHVGGFGPQLTPFGRAFKMNGYTARTVKWNVPLSAMAVASYTHTATDQPPPPAKDFAVNDNLAIDQISLFVAGGLGDHFGAFVQTTYDGVAHAFHWDNLDLRAVAKAKFHDHDLLFGASVNNAPTVQDTWNTLGAWGYPYTSSTLAPGAPAAPLISGAFAQTSLGVTGYVLIDEAVYIEAGGYQSPGATMLTRLGVDPTSPGSISGTAPYVRVAYQKDFGDQNFQLGGFYFGANIYPGLDRTTGQTDRYTDFGLDGSYQYFGGHSDVFTLNARYTTEKQHLDASAPLGLVANPRNTLEEFRVDGSYYWRNRLGASVQLFNTWGSSDPVLYSNPTAKPDTTGLMFQIDGTPWGAGTSPLGPRFNARIGLQYTAYLKYAGAGENYDGAGRSAGANNTLRLFTWIAY